MKVVLATLAACAMLTTSTLAADPAGPADKTDSGSLSSGAKEASPATKKQGENAPVGAEGDASTGASAGGCGRRRRSPARIKAPDRQTPRARRSIKSTGY